MKPESATSTSLRAHLTGRQPYATTQPSLAKKHPATDAALASYLGVKPTGHALPPAHETTPAPRARRDVGHSAMEQTAPHLAGGVVAAPQDLARLKAVRDAARLNGNFFGLTVKQLGQSAIAAGPGTLHAARGVGSDLVDAERAIGTFGLKHGIPATGGARASLEKHPGDFSFDKTRAIGTGMYQGVKADITHPTERPGFLLFDALAALSGGAGSVARVSAASKLARAGANTGDVLRGLRKPAPETFPITKRTDTGRTTVNKLVSRSPLLGPVQKKVIYPWLEDQINKRPVARQQPSTIAGKTAAKIRRGVQQKVWSPELSFGRELRAERRVQRDVFKAPAAELRGAAGGQLHDAPILDRLPKRLQRGTSRAERKAIQAISIFGDHAITRPDTAISRATSYHGELAQQAAAKVAEHMAAIQTLKSAAVDAEHDGAFDELAHIDTQMEKEQAQLEHQLGLLDNHKLQAVDFASALEPLKRLGKGEASEHFKDAVRLTREVAQKRTTMLQDAGLVTAESAAFRDAAPAAVYQHAHARGELEKTIAAAERARQKHVDAGNPRVVENIDRTLEDLRQQHAALGEKPLVEQTRVVRTQAENPRAREARRQLDHLDVQIGKLHEAYKRSAKRQRPRSLREAELELARLHETHAGLVESFKKALTSTKVTPEDAARMLAEHDAKIAAARAEFEQAATKSGQLAIDLKAGLSPEDLAAKWGRSGGNFSVIGQGKQAKRIQVPVRYGADVEAAARVAEKRLRALERGRARFAEAVKTGRLKHEYDMAEHGRRQKMRNAGMKVQTLNEELHQAALDAIEEGIRKHPDHPSFQRFAAEKEHIARLMTSIEQIRELTDPVFGRGEALSGEELSHLLGTVPVGHDEALGQRLGTLNEYRDSLQAELDKALGSENAVELQTLADTIIEKRRQLDEVPGAYRTPLGHGKPQSVGEPVHTPQPGATGYAPSDARRMDGAIGHEFKAGQITAGDMTADTTGAVQSDYLRAVHVVTRLGFYKEKLWPLSTRTLVDPENQVAIRDPAMLRNVPEQLKRILRRLDQGVPISADDIHAMSDADIKTLDEYLHPRDHEGQPLVDDRGKVVVARGTDLSKHGIRWVDRRYAADLGDIYVPNAIIKAADLVNNPVRFLALYARGGYVLNLPGNIGMQALTQGWLAPSNYARAFQIREMYGDRIAATIESLVGEGKARAYYVDTGAFHKMNEGLANFWSRFIDKQSRVSSLLHQMRQEGVNLDSRVEVDRFLHSPEMERARTAAVRRANKDMVDFSNMTPLERNTIRHLIFVYPWVSRATVWAGRMMLEHPGKVWTLNELGQQADLQQLKEIGELPGYLKERGYYGFKHAGKAYLVGTSPINSFGTAADNAKLLGSMIFHGLPHPREAASPALDLAVGILTGQNSQGRDYKGGGLIGAVKDTVTGLPQYQTLVRLGIVGKKDLSRKPLEKQPTFQKTGIARGAGTFALSSMWPQEANLDVAHARAKREELDAMPPVQRAAARLQDRFSGWLTEARKVGLYGKGETWDPTMQQVLSTITRREVSYAQAAEKLGVPVNRLNQRDRANVDVELMQKLGLMSAADASEEKKMLAGLTDDEVKSYRRQLSSNYFGTDVITSFKHTMADAGVKLK